MATNRRMVEAVEKIRNKSAASRMESSSLLIGTIVSAAPASIKIGGNVFTRNIYISEILKRSPEYKVSPGDAVTVFFDGTSFYVTAKVVPA